MAVDLNWESSAQTATLYLGEFAVAEITVDRRSARTAHSVQRTFEIEMLLPGATGRTRAANMPAARAAAEAAVTAWLTRAGLA